MAPLPSAGNNTARIRETLVFGQHDPFIDSPTFRARGPTTTIEPIRTEPNTEWKPTRPDSPYPRGTPDSSDTDMSGVTPRSKNKAFSTPSRVGKFLLGKLQQAGAAVKGALPNFERTGNTKRLKLSENSPKAAGKVQDPSHAA